jgi:hypothetical protein
MRRHDTVAVAGRGADDPVRLVPRIETDRFPARRPWADGIVAAAVVVVGSGRRSRVLGDAPSPEHAALNTSSAASPTHATTRDASVIGA